MNISECYVVSGKTNSSIILFQNIVDNNIYTKIYKNYYLQLTVQWMNFNINEINEKSISRHATTFRPL